MTNILHMQKTILLSIVFCLIIFSRQMHAQPKDANAIIMHSESISNNDFLQFISVLAHDSLEGRNTGSAGYIKASSFISNNLQKWGIQPGIKNDCYYQPVDISVYSFVDNTLQLQALSSQKNMNLVYGKDFSCLIPTSLNGVNEKQRIVFVANGIIDRQKGINDYEGLDVKGKTVVIEASIPKYIKPVSDPEQFNPFSRIQIAIDQGASGVVLFYRQGIIQKLFMNQIHEFLKEPVYGINNISKPNPMLTYDAQLVAFAHRKLVKNIFKAEDLHFKDYLTQLKDGQKASFESKTILQYEYQVKLSPLPCRNVIGLIEGSDSELKNECIVVSAHLDHLGIGKQVKKDSVYNGAWDNASGSAALLSLAKTIKDSPVQPKRSIALVWFTGEERGLLGSYFFADNPTLGKKKIVANINLDMPGGFYEASDIIPLGYGMSNISNAIDFATQSLNMTVNDSSALEMQYFKNSDHFAFVEQGIPAVFLHPGLMAVDLKINGNKTYKKWMKKNYHKPSDDLAQDFTGNGFLKSLKLNYLTSLYLANEIPEVLWNKENTMYKKYVLKK